MPKPSSSSKLAPSPSPSAAKPASASAPKKRGQKKGRGRAALGLTADDGPARMCIVCRAAGSPETLLRFARSPDGAVGFDVRARLPGRGAWVCATPSCLQKASDPKHGGFARAFDAAVVFDGATLRREVEEALHADVCDRLGLLRRQGSLILGRDDAIRHLPDLAGIGLAIDLSENSRHELQERAVGATLVTLPPMVEVTAAVGHDRAVGVVGIPKRGGDALLQAAVRLTPFLKPAAAAPAAG
jgi:predicted RNA-binding protein YlxR (DUF448 family)